ncbi:MAG: hypothetical protein P3B98_11020 [Gemmatimonadota bacterium]|nr:hypothetical protein [Gemmatimonadota bacterium]
MDSPSQTPAPEGAPWSRTVAIGCFMAPLGFFSGGMVSAFVSKAVAYLTKAAPCDGVPACNWLEFTVVGGVIGMISLPAIVMWALRTPKRPEQ